MMKPKISVIICTYNRADSLKDLLECLLIQDLKEAYEVIVVDNNSRDGTQQMVKSFEPKFQGRLLYFFESRQGKPFALNLGIKEARGEIIAFTDDDCLVEKDYLSTIDEAFQKYGDEIGVVGGRIAPRWVNGDKPEWFVKLKPGWFSNTFFYGPLGILDYGDKSLMIDFAQGLHQENLFYGANICIRKELLDRYGFFNIEKIVTQDTEICLRLFRAGVKGAYVPDIIVHHKINAQNITPHYYYHWYFLRGTLFDIQQKYKKKFYHPFGIQWEIIALTVSLWISSLLTSSLGNKVYLRSRAYFNFGQMVQIAKNHKKPSAREKYIKILFVRTYCPNPVLYGSDMRASRFVDYFQKLGQVDLLTLTKPTDMADMDYIKNNFTNFYHFDQKGNHSRLTAFERIIRILPWQITQFYAFDFQKQLNLILESNQYNLIFVFKLDPVFYFLQLANKWHKKIVLDFDDILSELYMCHYKNPLTAIKNSYSLKFYEQKALIRFKRIFVCSIDAKLKIPPKYRSNVIIVPNIFPVANEHFPAASGNQNQMLFVGSLDYFPNTEGLKWFFDSVWPQVKKTYPALKMTVVGKAQKDPPSMASFFGNPKDVDIFLNVPSVIPYYQNCFASIVPLLNGSGTRLKILESAAYGRPVITTIKGMEGLDFNNGKDIFVFQDARSFLDSYKSLLNKECYDQVADSAFRVLKERYSLNAFISSMDENWQRIIA